MQQPQVPKKKKPLEYVSISLPRNDIKGALDDAFRRVSSEKAKFYKQLEGSRRVQPEFHVTLIHRANSQIFPEIWKRYIDMHAEASVDDVSNMGSKFGECQIMLERVCTSSFYTVSTRRKLTKIDCMG